MDEGGNVVTCDRWGDLGKACGEGGDGDEFGKFYCVLEGVVEANGFGDVGGQFPGSCQKVADSGCAIPKNSFSCSISLSPETF